MAETQNQNNDEIAELEDQIDQLKARIIVLKLENLVLEDEDIRVPIDDYIAEITFVPQRSVIVTAVCMIARERGNIWVTTDDDCFVVNTP